MKALPKKWLGYTRHEETAMLKFWYFMGCDPYNSYDGHPKRFSQVTK